MQHIMKGNKTLFNLLLLVLMFLGACKKQELKLYQDDSPSLYGLTSYSYSFIEDITAQSKTIYLNVRLSGELKDYDRSFKIEPVFDSTTTAKKEWFEIGEGILPKNSVVGSIPVILKRNEIIDTSLVQLTVKLLPSSELGTMLGTSSRITWTAKIIQPVNWGWMRYYLGADFSTDWFKFVMKVTGRSSFPYYPTMAASDPVTWWMSLGEIQAWGLKVKEAHTKYNLEHPNDPLIHNDGPKAGLPVVFY